MRWTSDWRRVRGRFAAPLGPRCRTRCRGRLFCQSMRGSRALRRPVGSTRLWCSSGVRGTAPMWSGRRTSRYSRWVGCLRTPFAAGARTTSHRGCTRFSKGGGCRLEKPGTPWVCKAKQPALRRGKGHGDAAMGRRAAACHLDDAVARNGPAALRAWNWHADICIYSVGRQPQRLGNGRGFCPWRRGPRFEALAGALTPVRTPVGDAWILTEDAAAFRRQSGPAAPARLLPSGDTYYLFWGADRELLTPEAKRRAALWTTRVWPGALLVSGEVAGVWRRSGAEVSIEP